MHINHNDNDHVSFKTYSKKVFIKSISIYSKYIVCSDSVKN